MRPRAELDFIRDRVLAEIRATPPAGPLLAETVLRARPATCLRGHDRRGQRGECHDCRRLRVRAFRAMGRG